MSRLYDRIMTDKELRKDSLWSDSRGNMVVVSVDNITESIHSREDNNGTWANLPCLIPPFSAAFIETIRPRNVTHLRFVPDRWGCVVLTPNQSTAYSNMERFLKVTHNRDVSPSAFKGIEWYVEFILYVEIRNQRLLAPIAHMALALDRDGGVIWPSLMWYVPSFYDGIMTAFTSGMGGTPWEREAVNNLIHEGLVGPLFAPIMHGIGLMNCKNVVLVDEIPTKAMLREERRRNKSDLVTYKTLRVNPMRTVKHYAIDQQEQPDNSNPANLPLHIARGHFKDFRDGKGLFGKLKGIYWWDQHVRGDIENGAVIKDYDVQAHLAAQDTTP